MENKKPLLAIALLCAAGVAQAGEKEELLKLRNTTTSLIKQLVKQGVLTSRQAEDMIKQAEADAEQQAAQAKAESGGKAADSTDADEVRVTYVPDFVKDEIRQQVRAELKNDVVGDVLEKAKKEQWGIPDALPDWVRRIKFSGDIRLREEFQFFGQDNQVFSYPDFQFINQNGGFSSVISQRLPDSAFINTTRDRNALRERFRLSIDAKIAEGWDANIRLATGNIRNPISTNQDLGNTGGKLQFSVDRAFIKYNAYDDNKLNWFTFAGGRIQNPWFTANSEIVWDRDLSFEGIAGTVRHRFASKSLVDQYAESAPTVFLTGGIFPLETSSDLGSDTKWFFGGQLGLDWGFKDQDSLKAGLAYYDYQNIRAKLNRTVNNDCNNDNIENVQSAPQFLQFGNTLTGICINQSTGFADFFGLASDYKIINANVAYDLANFAPIHITVSGDYAKNIGYSLIDNPITPLDTDEQTDAWQFRLDVGWPNIDHAGNWNVFATYKRIERDAVLDAFTDSNFHLGGTNARGWTIGGNYGLTKRVWLTGRWLSTSVVTGPTFDVDVLLLDLNTRF